MMMMMMMKGYNVSNVKREKDWEFEQSLGMRVWATVSQERHLEVFKSLHVISMWSSMTIIVPGRKKESLGKKRNKTVRSFIRWICQDGTYFL